MLSQNEIDEWAQSLLGDDKSELKISTLIPLPKPITFFEQHDVNIEEHSYEHVNAISNADILRTLFGKLITNEYIQDIQCTMSSIIPTAISNICLSFNMDAKMYKTVHLAHKLWATMELPHDVTFTGKILIEIIKTGDKEADVDERIDELVIAGFIKQISCDESVDLNSVLNGWFNRSKTFDLMQMNQVEKRVYQFTKNTLMIFKKYSPFSLLFNQSENYSIIEK